MKVIDNWLSSAGRNYVVGKIIYQTFGTDVKLMRQFDTGETPQNRSALEKALRSLLPAGPLPAFTAHSGNNVPPVPKKAAEAPAVRPDTLVMPDTEDPVLTALKKEWMQPYTEMNTLRHQQHAFGSANDPNAISRRRELAFQILQLEQDCMAVWKNRDHYLQHKTLPAISKEAFQKPTDPLELGKMVEATKRRIREWRHKSKQDPGNAVAAQKLVDYYHKYFLLTDTQYQDKQ